MDELKKIIEKLENLSEYQKEVFGKLSSLDENTFKLAKELFYDQKIKICIIPVFPHTIFNINIIKELNTTQLKYILQMMLEELEKRPDK